MYIGAPHQWTLTNTPVHLVLGLLGIDKHATLSPYICMYMSMHVHCIHIYMYMCIQLSLGWYSTVWSVVEVMSWQ